MLSFRSKHIIGFYLRLNCSRHLSMIKQDAFVDSKWVKSSEGTSFDVSNPVDGKVIASVPNLNRNDVEKAICIAAESFKKWSLTTAKERSQLLRKWFDKINENSEELSQILSAESGKPIAEAKGEVIYGNSFIEWFSEEARRCNGEIVPSPVNNKAIFHIKQPIGVASVITPWNFPVAMITRKVGAALAAGCTVIIKPAEDTPLSALALAHYSEGILPPGVLNVVTCSRDKVGEIGSLLCTHPLIAGVTFTGSTVIGKKLYELCSSQVKRLSLELGGNAPFIVFENADLEKAVHGVIISKFRNAGQTCVSANRILIHSQIFDEFIDLFKKKITSEFYCGQKMKPGVLSPLINKDQFNKVANIVKDAISKGAKVHCGGKPADYLGELFFEPTLLSEISPKMLCYGQEIFGPIASCIKFSTEEEAIEVSNKSESGLAGYFYSKDINQIFRVAKALQVGMVGVNEGMISTTEAAFGGVKQSGLGREGSHYGLDEFTNIKYICVGNLS